MARELPDGIHAVQRFRYFPTVVFFSPASTSGHIAMPRLLRYLPPGHRGKVNFLTVPAVVISPWMK
eukprot:88503-Hanusia_phi.AAC.1